MVEETGTLSYRLDDGTRMQLPFNRRQATKHFLEDGVSVWRQCWEYEVYLSEARSHRDEAFFAEFIALDDGRAISRDMQAPDNYKNLGIPHAVIRHMARDRTVVSSSGKSVPLLAGGESQTPEGTRVWLRLLRDGDVKRIDGDRYETLPASERHGP